MSEAMKHYRDCQDIIVDFATGIRRIDGSVGRYPSYEELNEHVFIGRPVSFLNGTERLTHVQMVDGSFQQEFLLKQKVGYRRFYLLPIPPFWFYPPKYFRD